MKIWKIYFAIFIFLIPLTTKAQQTLSLEDCKNMAIKNNHQLQMSTIKKDIAKNIKKVAKTKYLPTVDAIGGYQFFSREISLLNNGQKTMLSNIGTNVSGAIGTNISTLLGNLVQGGIISPQTAQQLGTLAQNVSAPIENAGNTIGQNLKDAFKTDTRSVWTGSVVVKQPIYVGGAISAANKIARINEQLTSNGLETVRQNTLFEVENAYWLIVSLKQKQKLANSYFMLVKKLSEDVHKMIKQGVATKATGLKVDVRVNEAEMQMLKVENGLSLSKMLLCQLCGLDNNADIKLKDEDKNDISLKEAANYEDFNDQELLQRPEIKMLQNAIDISNTTIKLTRATYLPQVALTGGYFISNPNLFNGFQRRFGGVWNIGVLVRVPLWNWREGVYKIRASKDVARIATIELNEAREKIQLQISQNKYKLIEAKKRLKMAERNVESAIENLRCANLGFKEGVIESTDVMAAQAAWQQAQTMRIDAQIEVKLAQVALQKAFGILQ